MPEARAEFEWERWVGGDGEDVGRDGLAGEDELFCGGHDGSGVCAYFTFNDGILLFTLGLKNVEPAVAALVIRRLRVRQYLG